MVSTQGAIVGHPQLVRLAGAPRPYFPLHLLYLHPAPPNCFLEEKTYIEVLNGEGWEGSQNRLHISVTDFYFTGGQRCAAVLSADLHVPVTLRPMQPVPLCSWPHCAAHSIC